MGVARFGVAKVTMLPRRAARLQARTYVPRQRMQLWRS